MQYRSPPSSYFRYFKCINLADDSCTNGGLPGAGKDSDFLGGGNSPGKRSYF